MIKLKLLLALILILVLMQNATVAFAKDATPSSTPTANSDESLLQQKLNQLKQEVASKAAQIKQEVNKKLENKFVSGQITDISSTKIIITTTKGSRTVMINEYTAFSGTTTSKTGKKVTIKAYTDLTVNDYVTALGDVDNNSVLSAKKVIKESKPEDNFKAVWGNALSATGSAVTVKTRDNSNVSVVTNKSTNIIMDGTQIALGDIPNNKTVIAIGAEQTNKSVLAQFIYVLPDSNEPSPKPKTNIATSSAEASKSATKSAAPKKK